jgi:LIM domain-binding protein 1
MVVGEPSLMGGEFGDEDERLITRLENSQYDAAAALDNEPFGSDSPLPGPNSWPPPQDRPPHGNRRTSQENDKRSSAVNK